MSKRKTSALRAPDPRFQTRQNMISTASQSKTIDFGAVKKAQRRRIELVPKTLNQERYILALVDNNIDVVVAGGPAGTGKTYLSTLRAVQALRDGDVRRIVLCRPAVSIEGENHGFLPGDLTQKLAPWVRPVTDILREYYSVKEIAELVEEEIIEFAPLGFLRGRTFKDTFLILDEAQNATPIQIKSLLTRIGSGSKYVLNGDIEQADRNTGQNGLLDLQQRLFTTPIDGIALCQFELCDVQRHHLIGPILGLYR